MTNSIRAHAYHYMYVVRPRYSHAVQYMLQHNASITTELKALHLRGALIASICTATLLHSIDTDPVAATASVVLKAGLHTGNSSSLVLHQAARVGNTLGPNISRAAWNCMS